MSHQTKTERTVNEHTCAKGKIKQSPRKEELLKLDAKRNQE